MRNMARDRYSRSPVRYGAPQGRGTVQHEEATSLDATFHKLVFEIQQRMHLFAKAPKIRLDAWLRKLHEPETNIAWKKNRNNYARLLLEMLKLGRLETPFDTQGVTLPAPPLPHERLNYKNWNAFISSQFFSFKFPGSFARPVFSQKRRPAPLFMC